VGVHVDFVDVVDGVPNAGVDGTVVVAVVAGIVSFLLVVNAASVLLSGKFVLGPESLMLGTSCGGIGNGMNDAADHGRGVFDGIGALVFELSWREGVVLVAQWWRWAGHGGGASFVRIGRGGSGIDE